MRVTYAKFCVFVSDWRVSWLDTRFYSLELSRLVDLFRLPRYRG